MKWLKSERGFLATTETGTYEIVSKEHKWGCLRNGQLCDLTDSPDQAKAYASQLHSQILKNPWPFENL